MTIQGAINELLDLIHADDVPEYYNGIIQKVIETILLEMADRKTEPQASGYQTFNGASVYVSRLEDEDEATISKMEQVDEPQTDCYKCADFWNCDGQCDEAETEPQTDCAWK